MTEEDIFVDGSTGAVSKTPIPADSAIYKARKLAAIDTRLAELDRITGPRWAEVLHKGESDPFILDKIAEKESLRAQRRALED